VGEFFGSMAQRVGMTPEQLFEKYRLRTVAESVAGGQQFDQVAIGQPLDTVRTAWREAGIDFDLMERGDVVTVSKIVVPEGAREAGAGTRAMEQLVAWADANGKHLALTPSADFGGNAKRLTAFYKRFGFKENKGKSLVFSVAEGMVREAKNGATLYQSGALRTDTPAFRAGFGRRCTSPAPYAPTRPHSARGSASSTRGKPPNR